MKNIETSLAPGTIVIAFYTMGITGVYSETEDRMGQVARLIVEYFDGMS